MAALDLQSLKDFVGGAPARNLGIGTILMDLTHNLLASRFVEIAFEITNSIASVKSKVYSMTGSSESHMRLLLNGRIEMREEDNKLLGEYGARSGDFIHVIDEDPFSTARGGAMDDVSQVAKFELTEEQYDKRDNTYRAYKRKQIAADPNWKSIYQVNSDKRQAALKEQKRLAGYPDEKYESVESIQARVQVGQRCIVKPGDRRGEVKYVGTVPELTSYEVVDDGSQPAAPVVEGAEPVAAVAAVPAPAAPVAAADAAAAAVPAAAAVDGEEDAAAVPPVVRTIALVGPCIWIGVQLDEPVGKHDGILKGVRYFQSNHHAGIFAKPSAVKTGDYPEVDPFASDEEGEDAAEKGEDIYEEL
jgi:tubulin-folding cofactor B